MKINMGGNNTNTTLMDDINTTHVSNISKTQTEEQKET